MVTNVLQWLETTAATLPDKRAVADETSSLSFSELEAYAKGIGSWIAGRTEPRHGVALYLEKSPAALAAMLGAVYAGCFYTVIDVRQSEPRVKAIATALEARWVITDERFVEAAHAIFDPEGVEVVTLEAIGCPEPSDTLDTIRAQALDTDPLYVNFTSGSTGTPKGVVVSHRSVVDFIPQFSALFGFTSDDVIANQAPFDFDVSVKDIYTALLTGASMRLVPRDFFTQPTRLMDYLCDNHVTSLTWAVSAMCFVSIMNAFDYRVPTEVRRVMFSGEVMPPKQLAVWKRYLPDALYVNLYGPTEITCNCTYYVVERDYGKDETIPMGMPFPNERVFLLGEGDTLVTEEGEQGEVCVAGTALALGYLAAPELTAAAFVQNPLEKRWMETIYRTGDLAFYDGDGELVYAGRKDHQIKHMGQRIELGDIEAAAQGSAGVDRAVCLYDAKRKRLHLVYCGATEKDALVAHLKETLPQYMVPNRTHQVDEMPLTKNGKVDRAALGKLCRIR